MKIIKTHKVALSPGEKPLLECGEIEDSSGKNYFFLQTDVNTFTQITTKRFKELRKFAEE